MTSMQTVADASSPCNIVLVQTTGLDEARMILRPGGLAVLGDPTCGLVAGIVRFERLAMLTKETALDEAAEPAALVPSQLPLDVALRMLLAHSQLRWLVTETGSLISREQLVPAALESYTDAALDRAGLSGDPIALNSSLRYRCPIEPEMHVFSASQIEVWTTDLKARCPIDGKLMTAFLAVPDELE